MLGKSPSVLSRVVTSLKVVALATVLATVVLAAERHLALKVAPDEAVAEATAPASGAEKPSAPADGATVYFPSQFAEPTGEPAAQAPTF